MSNRADEYPEQMLCPLVEHLILVDDCIENQNYADRLIMEDTLPPEYMRLPNWRDVCQQCKYHEID